MRKLSQDVVIKRLYESHPDFDFSHFLYNGRKKKGKVICNKGHIWQASYDQLTSKIKHGCPICSGNKKLTQDEAIKNLQIKHPNYNFSNFIYKNARTPSEVTCNNGHSWKVSYYSSMTGCGCPICASDIKAKKKRLSEDIVYNNLKKAHPDFDFSEFKYIKAQNKSKVKCSKGHIWYTTYEKLMMGRGCLDCQARTQEEALKILREKRPEYDFSNFIYTSSISKSTVICDKGHQFSIRFSKIMEGVGCPICKTSKGEYRIRKWLINNNLDFEPQKTFNDAKYKLQLRWDFYLPKYNVLIEYNGRQHYEFVASWHKDLIGFRAQLERDMLKQQYAHEHNITQIIISFEDYNNIEFILEEQLINRNKGKAKS